MAKVKPGHTYARPSITVRMDASITREIARLARLNTIRTGTQVTQADVILHYLEKGGFNPSSDPNSTVLREHEFVDSIIKAQGSRRLDPNQGSYKSKDLQGPRKLEKEEGC